MPAPRLPEIQDIHVIQARQGTDLAQVQKLISRASALLTTPPASPRNGDVWHYSPVEGVVWAFRFNEGSSSGYKWEFIGGPPQFALVDASETSASTTYVNLATNGPDITLDIEGDYMIRHGFRGVHTAAGAVAMMTPKIGAAAEADGDGVRANGAGAQYSVAREKRHNAIPAASLIRARYKVVGAGTGTWVERYMSITPVRVEGV